MAAQLHAGVYFGMQAAMLMLASRISDMSMCFLIAQRGCAFCRQSVCCLRPADPAVTFESLLPLVEQALAAALENSDVPFTQASLCTLQTFQTVEERHLFAGWRACS